ncbi:MAG: hypothetical protein Kow0090_22730 [Myxococcota bacterium]
MTLIYTHLKKLPFSQNLVKTYAERAVKALSIGDPVLSILLVGDAKMRRLNIKFRGEDRATDILSFPTTDFSPGAKPDNKAPIVLGDIVINIHAVKRQAKRHNHSEIEELCILLAHGLSHLLGYTHKGRRSKSEMKEKERKILKTLLGGRRLTLIERVEKWR